MTASPGTVAGWSALLAEHHAARRPLPAWDLTPLRQIREHTPEDMTIVVEAGLTLAALQAHLAQHGQWLPVDPPHPETLTIERLLSANLCGPRRCGHGTIREHLIGLEAVLADGRVTHSGGKVVKNVAGYDVQKLFVGARGSLGLITAATFKLLPVPATEIFLEAVFPELAAAWKLVDAVIESPLTPVVLDLHRSRSSVGCAVVLGLAGTAEETDWQRSRAVELGFREPATLDYDREFWSGDTLSVQTRSVLPSRLPDWIAAVKDAPFVARAANGVLHARADLPPAPATAPATLTRRLKEMFDPHHILPASPS